MQNCAPLLEAHPEDASTTDVNGKLPIHIISQNEALLKHRRQRDEVGTFIRDLSDVYPPGILTEDGMGRIPLLPIIQHWIEKSHQIEFDSVKLVNGGSAFSRLVLHFQSLDLNAGALSSGRDTSFIQSMPSSREEDYHCIFPNVFVPADVEWALVLLSRSLNDFDGPLSRQTGTRLEQLSNRAALANRVAGIPFFLKTILLIEDFDTRSRIMDLSIVRRVMLCETTIGRWLMMMLKTADPSHRVVEYFILLSTLDISDFIGKARSPKPRDFGLFRQARDAVFEAVAQYDDILPSLITLPDKEIERVSRTKVVW